MKQALRTAIVISVLGLLAGMGSAARAQPSLNGEWAASWSTAKQGFLADVVIDGASGTWQTRATNRRDNCVGLKYPMSVERVQSGAAIRLKVHGAETLQGCPDFVVHLKASDEATLEGNRGQWPIVLRRK